MSHPIEVEDKTTQILVESIRICDDLLSTTELEKINSHFNIDYFDDNYRDGSYIGSDIHSNDLLYKEFISILTHACNRFLISVNYPIIKTVQVRVLLVSDFDTPLNKSRHKDDTCYDLHGFTMSYHWFGAPECGGTAFYKNHESTEPVFKIPFRPNRLAVFPANLPHEGYALEGYANNSKRVIFSLFTILNDEPKIIKF